MNTVVKFEIAKLLKEKEFDEPCKLCVEEGDERPLPFNCGNTIHRNSLHPYYSAPTIAEVVMWLYEKHGIWISVDWMPRSKPFNSGFYCHLRGINRPLNQDNFISINNTTSPGYEVFDSPTEAYEAAIEYTLTKLI